MIVPSSIEWPCHADYPDLIQEGIDRKAFVIKNILSESELGVAHNLAKTATTHILDTFPAEQMIHDGDLNKLPYQFENQLDWDYLARMDQVPTLTVGLLPNLQMDYIWIQRIKSNEFAWIATTVQKDPYITTISKICLPWNGNFHEYRHNPKTPLAIQRLAFMPRREIICNPIIGLPDYSVPYHYLFTHPSRYFHKDNYTA